MKIILASNSPRRKELLALAKIEYDVKPADIDEVLNNSLSVPERIENIAFQKVKEIQTKTKGEIILGADTVVVINGLILGKPHSKEEAYQMIKMLSGQTHQVITGVCIYDPNQDKFIKFDEITDVTFYEITDDEIKKYVENPSIYDKAGAYAIQEEAALFVKSIKGDYYNIMGLPIARVVRELQKISNSH